MLTQGTTSSLVTLAGWRTGNYGAGALTDCNLVVPTYCRPKTVLRLLAHLVRLEERPAEVVLVDGSPDALTGHAVAEWARRTALPFVLLYVASPPGLTRQRNVGIDASTGEFVFYLDDDCLPQAGYFRAIRQVFARDLAGVVGAVAGTLINELNQPLSWRWRTRRALGLIPRNGESGRYYPTATSVPRALAQPFHGVRPTDILPGAAFACRRQALLGQRFSLFFAGYSQGEDLEMSLRLRKNWQLRWCGDAHAVHEQEPASRPGGVAKGRMEIVNRHFIWRRYTPQPTRACRAQLWLDFLFVLGWDLASALAHPGRHGFGAHALGVVRGMIECAWCPPQYKEPPARREYQFAWSPAPPVS
jgi:glycosyltransferase involved in cell wall biosynthesis